MRSLLFILLLSLVSLSLAGQRVSGLVLDAVDHSPISFANIYFPDLKTGTTTDLDGRFSIENLYFKNIQIQISFIGYQTIQQNINLANSEPQTFYLEHDHFTLQELVVSDAGGKLQGENIVHVEKMSIKELSQSTNLTLSEAISNIPGVEQNTTGAGIGKPVIRGLSGNRIVTYAQGIRIENQQWGQEHGLGVGEVGIEGVEVIKGPSSLLYGSDALGGVLYFLDARYADAESVEASIQSDYLTSTLGFSNQLGFKINSGLLKFNLFGALASHADYSTPDSSRVFNTRFNEKNIKGALGFNTKNWITNIRYSYLINKYGIAEDATYTESSSRDFDLPYQSIVNQNLSLENIYFAGQSKFDLKLGYTSNNRKEFEDDVNLHALGLQLNTFTYNLKWHSPIYQDIFNVVLGSQGMSQTNENNGEEILIPDATTKDLGLFAISHIRLDKLNIQAGIRFDRRHIDTEMMASDDILFPALDKSYNGVTYSLGGRYNLNRVKLRANISKGFRAPNTSELLSDGVHEGTNRYERGNTDLTQEKAIQLDMSIEYQDDHFSISAHPFYNQIDQYIFLAPTNMVIDNNSVFDYDQQDAKLYGGEMGFHIHPHSLHWLHVEGSLSTIFGRDNEDQDLPLIPQTKTNTTLRVDLEQSGLFQIKNIFIQHIHKFNQNNIGQFESPTPSYNLVNFGMSIDISSNNNNPIEVSFGIKNVFNTTYIDHLSRFKDLNIPELGRNYYLSVGWKWNRSIAK